VSLPKSRLAELHRLGDDADALIEAGRAPVTARELVTSRWLSG